MTSLYVGVLLVFVGKHLNKYPLQLYFYYEITDTKGINQLTEDSNVTKIIFNHFRHLDSLKLITKFQDST